MLYLQLLVIFIFLNLAFAVSKVISLACVWWGWPYTLVCVGNVFPLYTFGLGYWLGEDHKIIYQIIWTALLCLIWLVLRAIFKKP